MSRIGCVCKRNCFCCHIPYLKLCVNLSSFLRGVPCPQPPRKPKGIGLEYHNAPGGEQNSIMWQIWGRRCEKVVFSGSKMRLSLLPASARLSLGAGPRAFGVWVRHAKGGTTTSPSVAVRRFGRLGRSRVDACGGGVNGDGGEGNQKNGVCHIGVEARCLWKEAGRGQGIMQSARLHARSASQKRAGGFA